MSSQDGNLPVHMTASGGRSAAPGPLAGFYLMYAITLADHGVTPDTVLGYDYVAPFDMRIEEACFSLQSKTNTPTYGIINVTQSAATIVGTTNFTTGGEVAYWNGSSDGTGTLGNRNITKGDQIRFVVGNSAGDAAVDVAVMMTFYVKGHVNVSQAED